jgi:DNA invertase Pin-like site-specific DNA recombinase
MIPGQTDLPPSRGATYVRLSTEHQQQSASKQMDVIRDYAKRRGMQIVKEYSDEGKGGVNDQGREF